jgi:hypothetical protein
VSERIYLRNYQFEAVEQIVKIFSELAASDSSKVKKRATSSADELGGSAPASGDVVAEEVKQRVTIVCSPTGSGKTLVIKGVADRLASMGVNHLVLTYASPVAIQNQRAGLRSLTIQKFFRACDMVRAFPGVNESKPFSREDELEIIASHLSLPQGFFLKKCIVMVDESHLGLENMASMYDRVLSLIGAVMCVGFTATTRWKKYFKVIDLSPHVEAFVAPPRGSIIHTQWLGSLPNQAMLFPLPMLVFCRSVLTAGILSMAFELSSNGRHRSGMIVANGRKAIEDVILRFFLPDHRRKTSANFNIENDEDSGEFSGENFSDDDSDLRIEGGVTDGANLESVATTIRGKPGQSFDQISPVSMSSFRRADAFFSALETGEMMDPRERRLGMIVLFLVMSRWVREGTAGVRKFSSFGLSHGEVPRLPLAMQLVKMFLPEFRDDFHKVLSTRDREAATRISKFAGTSPCLRGYTPVDFVRGKIEVATSVIKISAGFNFPPLRTIVFAESVIGSRVLYEQRAGRGARKLRDKSFYDLVEFKYNDLYSDLIMGHSKVSWSNVFLKDFEERRFIMGQDLVFRHKLSPFQR